MTKKRVVVKKAFLISTVVDTHCGHVVDIRQKSLSNFYCCRWLAVGFILSLVKKAFLISTVVDKPEATEAFGVKKAFLISTVVDTDVFAPASGGQKSLSNFYCCRSKPTAVFATEVKKAFLISTVVDCTHLMI